MRLLIKQAIILPLLFFIPVILAGLLSENYDSIKQQASEITITEFRTAKIIVNSGAILTGLSCILFSLGLFALSKRILMISALLLMLFGISMVSNGLYPMRHPMHGFYGMGLSLMILPFVCCFELKGHILNKQFYTISLLSGAIIFLYFWLTFVGLDPENYKGLTQRLVSVVIFGWIAYAAYEINKYYLTKNSLEISG